IVSAVSTAKGSMVVSLLLAIVAAAICGLLLMRAITAPMQRIVHALDRLRSGDLSMRLSLDRKDEFGAIESGFNEMAEALANLVAQAQRSSVQVTTSVTEIAATSKQQQATATETAATTTEIGATSREIAATSRDLVRTMTEVTSAADQASSLAGSGQQGLARMEETMHQVMGAADLVNAKLGILNEKASNITQMVVTIVKVADQTNLLALNAAIEAARAGEQGRGFAVVADEVRALARRTRQSTEQIEVLVASLRGNAQQSVAQIRGSTELVRLAVADALQTESALGSIAAAVSLIQQMNQQIAAAAEQQSSVAEEISRSVTQIRGSADQAALAMQDNARSSVQLAQLGTDLKGMVGHFRL
ncbi:methyl-accepting chemotaxis protein, partial [Arthrobacter frigidicola]